MELNPFYDRAFTFKGKATVFEEDDGSIVLYSFNWIVATIKDGKAHIPALLPFQFTDMTVRHIREFFMQNGLGYWSRKQIRALMGKEE